MVSVRNLEKLLKPYWVGGAASSAYTMYDEYQKGDVTVRIDEDAWFMRRNAWDIRKRELIKAAVALGLLSEREK